VTQFSSYEFEHRGYRLVFSADEKSCDISQNGVVLTTVRECSEIAFSGDEAVESTVTSLVAAIRWIGQHIKGCVTADAQAPSPTIVDSPLRPDEPTEIDGEAQL